IRLIRAYLNSGIMMDGVVQERVMGTPQGGPLTPLTQKVIANSRVYWRFGEPVTLCLTCALRGNAFMTDDPINQNKEGSAVECCFRHAPAQYAVARGYAALVWR